MTDSVNIKIDGKEYTDFTDVTVTKSIESFAGSFDFQTTSSQNIDFPLKVNSRCQIMIHGEQVINGFVDRIGISYDDNSHKIQVFGHDRTIDLHDSTVGGSESSEFKASKNGVTLKQITEKVLKEFNMSVVDVIVNHEIRPFNQENISAEYGTSGFDFIEKYAKKRQVLLTTNGDGNIVFTRTPTEKFKTQLILSKNAPSTILSAHISYNNSKRYNKYVGSSQNNPSALNQFYQEPKDVASVSGTDVFDTEIRNSRIYHFEPDFSSSEGSLKDSVLWEANFRRAQSQKWTYTVEGHIAKDDGVIWKHAKLVSVTDEFADKYNATLLISTVRYTFNSSEGSKTVLFLVPEDSFSLIVNKPESEKKASKGDLSQYYSEPDAQAKQGPKK